MARLRIGYIGAGSFTNGFMYPQLHAHDIEMVAVCDLVEEKAKKAQQDYGFQNVYTDFRKMCDEQKPDAIFCVGGPSVHYAIGMEILDRGFPLYIQKSPAPTTAATREMANLAKKRGVVCHVGFNIRSSPAIMRFKQYVESDAFGGPNLCIARYGLVTGRTIEAAVMDQHCHPVDTVRYLVGEVKDLHVTAGRLPNLRHYVVTLTFENGCVGTLNYTSEMGMRDLIYYEVVGLNGHAIHSRGYGLCYSKLRAASRELGQEPDIRIEPPVLGGLEGLRWKGYVADVANFLAAVRGSEPDRSPIESTIGTMEIGEEVCRQLREAGVKIEESSAS